MRVAKTFLAVLAVFLSAAAIDSPRDAAQQGAPEVSASRPFLKTDPTSEAAAALAAKAADGEAESQAALASAGLTFVPALQRHRGGHEAEARELERRQMRAHHAWIVSMLGWELALARPFAPEVVAAYEQRKENFQNAEAQLARAILHSTQLGDDATRKKLVESAPASPWVRAADAWQSSTLAPKECAERLLAVLPAMLALRDFHLRVSGTDLQEVNPAEMDDDELMEAEFGQRSGPTVLRAVHAVPPQWSAARLCERIGALCTESGDQALAKATLTKVQGVLGKAADADLALKAFALGSNPESEKHRSITESDWDSVVGDSCGPALAAYAFAVCADDRRMERTAARIAAFRLAPDLAVTQRALLRDCLAGGDSVLARLALRSLLVLRDDWHDSLVLLSFELMASKELTTEREKFRTALEATKNAKLVALAKAVKAGDSSKLPKAERIKLQLPVAARAALVAAFASAEELQAYGGNEGVYWLTQAAMLMGVRAVHSGSRAYWEAIETALKLRPKDPIHPAIYEYRQARVQFMSEADMAAEDKVLAGVKPVVAKAIEAFAKEISDDSKGYENCALTAAQALARQGSTVLPAEIEKPLLEKLDRWGAQGLCLVGDLDLLAGKYSRRKLLFEQAEVVGPLVRRVHYYQTPRKDSAGTYGLANFDVAARSTLRLLLLEPLQSNAWGTLGSVGIRTGQGVLAVTALVRQCASYCADSRLSGVDSGVLQYLPSIVLAIGQQYRKSRAVFGQEWPEVDHSTLGPYLLRTESYTSRKASLAMLEILSRRGYLSNHCLRVYESQGGPWTTNVDELLNATINLWRHSPEKVYEYTLRARKLGTSEFGEYVGSQGSMAALGLQGKADEAMKLYTAHRKPGVRTSSLDVCLLIGLLHSNRWQELQRALDLIAEQEWQRDSNSHDFALRRALMALGKHDRVIEADLAAPRPASYITGIVPYSRLFHEARHLLDTGDFAGIISRTEPYLSMQAEDGLGVYVDAALMRALALKESGESINLSAGGSTMSVLEPNYLSLFMTSPALLDWHVLQILGGLKTTDSLPKRSGVLYWHGTVFSERAPTPKGSGAMTDGEVDARDSFIRGLIAYLAGDNAAARVHLTACLKADQRCAYEYHVAEWLIGARLK